MKRSSSIDSSPPSAAVIAAAICRGALSFLLALGFAGLSLRASAQEETGREAPAQEESAQEEPAPQATPSVEIKFDIPPPEEPRVTLDLEGLHLPAKEPSASDSPLDFELFPDPLPGAASQPSPAGPAPEEEPDPRLVRVAEKVVASVLYFRGYDRFGAAISSGGGAFVSPDGIALADLSLIPPEIKGSIAYMTAVDGWGKPYRVEGALVRDAKTGSLLLKVELPEGAVAEPVEFAETIETGSPAEVAVVAFSPSRGMLVADAKMIPEEPPMEGWFQVSGENSPATSGSPVFDMEGRVVAISAISLPVKEWVTFALPVAHLPETLPLVVGTPIPFSKLKLGSADAPLSDSRFLDAFKSLSERRYRMAAKQFTNLTRTYPRSAEVWGMLGIAGYRLGATEQALAFFQRAAALRPDAGAYWLQIALAGNSLRKGLPRDVLEQAVRGQPNNADGWFLLAGAQSDESDFPAADESLSRAIQLDPSNAAALFLRAYVKGKIGDIVSAEEAAEQCVRIDRRNADAWFYLGLVRAKRGDVGAAIEAYREATRHAPEHPTAWMNLSQAYLQVGNRTEARVAFDKHRSLPAKKPDGEE